MATSTWSEAVIITWIGVSETQILILFRLSMPNLKVKSPDSRCSPLPLRVKFTYLVLKLLPEHWFIIMLAPTLPVPPNPSAERLDRPSSNSGNIYYWGASFNVPLKPLLMDWPEAPYQPVDVAVSAQSTVRNSKTLVHICHAYSFAIYSTVGDFIISSSSVVHRSKWTSASPVVSSDE